MNERKEVLKMTHWRKKKALIIIICLSLILLVFVIHQVLFSSNFLLEKLADGDDDDSESQDNYDSRKILPRRHKSHKFHRFKGEKWIHLDLKGAPPLVSYFKEFFPYIKSLGATGVLIEYEDMFFYSDELEDIRALNAYNISEIKTILTLAEENGLQVIPLIQTFGHLEFVLKLEKYRKLREVDAFPQVLCPIHEEAQALVHKMIDQVMKVHQRSKYIHIGCDEVKYVGQCKKCRAFLHNNGWTTFHLFINHVKNVALYINRTYPGVRPIIWADHIHVKNKRLLESSALSSFVDLMVWKYVPNVSDYVTFEDLKLYAELFKNIWIASAFKGATGSNQITTDSRYHLGNHKAWMEIVSEWEDVINFKGIAVTGWQRYDHFAMLCELLPVGIPSLSLSMQYLNGSLKGGNEEAIEKTLRCQSQTAASRNFLGSHISYCQFPGSSVYYEVNKFSLFRLNLGGHFSVSSHGWFSVYNIVHNFGSPSYVESIFKAWPVDDYLNVLMVLEEDLKRVLSEVYDEYTVKEWLLSYVTPLRIRLEAFSVVKNELLQQKVWPRRPLLNNSDDFERAAKEICTSDRHFGCAALLL